MDSMLASIKRLRIELVTGAVAAALSVACAGSSSTAPSTKPVTLHGEVSDLIGDAVPVAGVSNPPDLIHGTVDIVAGNVAFTVQLAPATFNRQTTGVLIDLDTDRNPSTGISGVGGFGIDYVVSLWAPTNQVMIQKALANGACTAAANQCYTTVGTASLTVTTDGVQATVPLALLGSTDGRLNFRVFGYYVASLSSGNPAILTDVMSDATLPPGSVQ
jgi:hypothetical protein